MASRSVLGGSDAVYDFTCSPCAKADRNREAYYHCAACHMFYCRKCVDTHNTFTEGHTVVDTSSDKFGYDVSNELPATICETHYGSIIKMYCGKHDTVGCNTCISHNHRSCEDVDYIPKIAALLLNGNVKETTKASLEAMRKELQKRKQRFQIELQRLRNERDCTVNKIKDYKRKLIREVENLEKSSLDDIKAKYRDMTDTIVAFDSKIDDFLDRVEKQLKAIESPVKSNAAQTVVDIKFAERINKEGAYFVTRCKQRREETVEFKLDSGIETFLTDLTSLGKAKVKPYRVGIVRSSVARDNHMVDSFMKFLEEELRSKFGIESECIQSEQVSTEGYTIVVQDMQIGLNEGFRESHIIGISRKPYTITILIEEKVQPADVLKTVGKALFDVPSPYSIFLYTAKNIFHAQYDKSCSSPFKVEKILDLVEMLAQAHKPTAY